jgi:anti-sigma B factor antagonist
VEIEGRININSSKLIETVGSILDSGVCKIIINMEGVDFVDYNGLSVLAIAYKSTLNSKGMMKLCGISLHILELLRVVKLDELFEIYDDEKQALESFKARKKSTKKETVEQPLRRRFTRLDIDIPVHYRLSKGLSGKGERELYTGRMANISGAGVFIRTINVFPTGSEVSLEIVFSKEKPPLCLRGIVLWVADKSLQPDLYPGMGVGFMDLAPSAQERIIEFVERNIVHRRE